MAFVRTYSPLALGIDPTDLDQRIFINALQTNQGVKFRKAFKMLKVIFAFLLLIPATSGWAQTYEKTYSKGNWALYRADGMEVITPNGQYERIDGLCLAALISPNASLKFLMAPSAVTAKRPNLRDYIWVQIAAENWDFRRRKASAGLSVEVSSYTERSAQYDGHAITFGVPDFKKNFGIFLMFAGSKKVIDVLDSGGKVIASFPTSGFSEVRDRLFKCAGV